MVTLVAPIAILAIWGGAYLYRCVTILSAPGIPVDFIYKAHGGEVHISAASYAIDLKSGYINVARPKVRNAAGELIASADSIHAEGLAIILPEGQRRIDVTVSNASGTITRNADGRIDLMDYLPEQTKTPSGVPFKVRVNRGRLLLVDYSGGERWAQRATATDVQADGFGDEWIATGDAVVDNVGVASATLQNMPGRGLLVRAVTGGLEISSLLEHFKGTLEGKKIKPLQELSAQELRLFGPVSLFLPKQKGFRLETALQAQGRNVRYGSQYAADTATFDGQVSETGAAGKMNASAGAMDAQFEGALRWADSTVLGGRLVANTPSSAAAPAWLRKLLPQKVSFAGRGHLDGWVVYEPKTGARLDSSLSADRVQAFGETLTSAAVRMHYDPARLRASIVTARWHNTPVNGFIDYGPKSKQIGGGLFADKLDLRPLAERLGVAGISGTGNVNALFAGTSANPTLAFRVHGKAGYQRPGHKKLDLGGVHVAGILQNDQLSLDRATINGPTGTVEASGKYAVNTKLLNLKVDAAGLDLSALNPDLGGVGRFDGRVTGTLKNPIAKGHAAAFAVKYSGQEVPIVLADVTASPENIFATNLRAVKGGTEATGTFAINLKSNGLSGDLIAHHLQLSDFLGDDYLGSVDVPDIRISGTLDKPKASGSASAENLLIAGTPIQSASLIGDLDGKELRVHDLKAAALEGALTGSGRYNFGAKSGSANLQASNLALRRILPATTPGTALSGQLPTAPIGTTLSGTASGSVDVAFNSKGLTRGDGKGTFANVALNGTTFGGGPWELHTANDVVTGSTQVGVLDRYIELDKLQYNTKTHNIAGEALLYNNKLQDLYTSVRPYLNNLGERQEEFLRSTDGQLDADISFSGPADNPDIDVKTLTAKSITLGGRKGGDMTASISRAGSLWTIQQVNWSGEPGILRVTGSIDEKGAMHLDGDVSNFDLSYLSLLEPSLTALRGKADLSFLASGQTESPVVDATFRTAKDSGVGFGADANGNLKPNQELQIVLDTIHVERSTKTDSGYSGGLTAQGKFYYLGFEGDVTALVPIDYPLSIPEGAPITASLTLPKRDLKDYKQFLTSMDTKRSKGSVEGKVEISGVLHALQLSGLITAQADSLAFDGVQTVFQGAVANVVMKEGRVDLSLTAKSSLGGSVNATYGLLAPEVGRLVTMIGEGNVDTLLATTADGTINLDALAIQQPIGKDGSVKASVDGKLVLGGQLKRPSITGPLSLANAVVVAPSETLDSAPLTELMFDPTFDIPITIKRRAQFKTSTADLALGGDGKLGGSASMPDLAADLRVESGTIRLPTTKITLEPGGVVRPLFQVNSLGETIARIDVDIEGRTKLTAQPVADQIARYDIILGVRGDLLKEGALTLTASSDPPDLSQDQILAMLGQVDVLQSLTESGARSGDAQRRILSALTGSAVPFFLDPLTSKLAATLGLEYLNVEYNAFEGTSLAFAKSIGKGLIIQGRRQISPPPFGQKPRFDLQLSYRLPFKNRQLRRVVFSAGIDQDRPWKLAIEYGFRY